MNTTRITRHRSHPNHTGPVRRSRLRGAVLVVTAFAVLTTTAVAHAGATAAEPPSGPGPVPETSGLVSLTPARLLETRPGNTTTDGTSQATGTVTAGTTIEIPVLGRGGVPDNATAVMLNVAAINPTAPGYLTVYPCGQTRPHASNLNYTAGQVIANAALTKVGTNGNICIYTSATTHLIADANAAFGPAEPPTIDDPPIDASGAGVYGNGTATGAPGSDEFVIGPDALVAASDLTEVPTGADSDRSLDSDFGLLPRSEIDGESARSGGDVPELLRNEPVYRVDTGAYTSSVDPAIGRLIMWKKVNGTWYRANSCSGTVVGRTMVLTAEHCLRDKYDVAYDAWSFIPALEGSSQPYGEWFAPGSRGFYPTTLDQYRNTPTKVLFDYAIIKFDPQYNGNRYLGDVTGSFPMWQGGANVTTKVTIGYPAEGFYDSANGGRCSTSTAWCHPYTCRSSDGSTADFGNNWKAIGYGCDANGGISGAAVFGYVNGKWYVVSVNSQGGTLRNRQGQQCFDRGVCSWYMSNLWGPEFKQGHFDVFYYEVSKL